MYRYTWLLVGILVFATPAAVQGETFSGTGSSTTATFESTEYTKITWEYTAENEFDLFNTFIYQEGSSVFSESFSGEGSTTYLYESGTYYFDVSAANIASWTITTSSTTGEFLSEDKTISGSQNKNTKLIDSPGEIEFTWEYTAENEFDSFNVYVYEVGNSVFSDTFSGSSGTSYVYGSGMYYLGISAANIDNYQIKFSLSGSGDTTSTSSTSTTNSTGSSAMQNDTGTTEAGNTAELFAILPMVAVVLVQLRKHN